MMTLGKVVVCIAPERCLSNLSKGPCVRRNSTRQGDVQKPIDAVKCCVFIFVTLWNRTFLQEPTLPVV